MKRYVLVFHFLLVASQYCHATDFEKITPDEVFTVASKLVDAASYCFNPHSKSIEFKSRADITPGSKIIVRSKELNTIGSGIGEQRIAKIRFEISGQEDASGLCFYQFSERSTLWWYTQPVDLSSIENHENEPTTQPPPGRK